jgi:hypothetical protein
MWKRGDSSPLYGVGGEPQSDDLVGVEDWRFARDLPKIVFLLIES